jgi:uncharacterized peroxidase-related enzyme
MAWIDVVGEDAAAGRLAELYQAIGRSRGKVSNIMRVHSLSPEAMKAHLDLYLAVMFGKTGLSRAQRELVATVVSAANRCDYCVSHHAEALNAYWKDRERVRTAVADFRNAELSGQERALVEFAEKLTTRPGEMTESDISALRDAGLDDREILSLNLIVAYFNFVNRITLGLGVEFSEEEVKGYAY